MTNTHICHSERSEESAFSFFGRGSEKQIPRARTALGMTNWTRAWRACKAALALIAIISATTVGSAYAQRPPNPTPEKPVTVIVDGPRLSSQPIPTEMMEASQTISQNWCQALPRPEYKTLERVLPNEPWFEVYKVAPGVFAIYEPHQAEEVISYLIVGTKQALLFDTGMGIANIHKVVVQLTNRPIVVLNSHTHNDHVGGNSLFTFIYGMDTDFTRQNAKGSRDDAQEELAPGMTCGNLPKGFDPKTYATKPWHVSLFVKNGFKINLGGRTLEIISTPGHTPDAICLIDRANGLLFTGDTYYPGPIWLFRPETNLDAYVASVKWLADLAPQVKVVLGAHNVPVADPSVLPRLVTAIESVRAGNVEAKPLDGGKASFTTDGITFLLKAPPAGVK
jgi:glyoxylase-like metal-dependent hydrolase (beta-lactamase superfamily II)